MQIYLMLEFCLMKFNGWLNILFLLALTFRYSKIEDKQEKKKNWLFFTKISPVWKLSVYHKKFEIAGTALNYIVFSFCLTHLGIYIIERNSKTPYFSFHISEIIKKNFLHGIFFKDSEYRM